MGNLKRNYDKKTQQELSKELEGLRQRVAELEEQLRKAQKMEAIGTIAGGFARDFNNILASIFDFTEMAMEDIPDNPKAEKNLSYVLKSMMRAKELVRQILSFGRENVYERSPISLSPVVKETILLLRAFIPANINIFSRITATSDTVFASPAEIQQLIMHLSANAAHAMEGRGSTLLISLTDVEFRTDSQDIPPDLRPGAYVQLAVRDDGTGMSLDVKERVFEPFFTTRGVGKGGAGIGLSVVYATVKSLYGEITVESELGVGSTFRIFLPKVRAKIKPERAHGGELPRGHERILFVDDEEMFVEWGQAVLERFGYTVCAAIDSADALRTFSSDPSLFDLVITDQAMPMMTGAQLSEEILKIRKDIPIILCMDQTETLSPEKTKGIGIREFLVKPFTKPELAQAIRRVLGTKTEG